MKASKYVILLLGIAPSTVDGQAVPNNRSVSARADSGGGRSRFPTYPRSEVRYEYGPDSRRHEGVPQGKITEFVWNTSQVYPGTIRRCAVYVPAQYDGSRPAALMVFQDGVRHYLSEDQDFRAPIVFDNLIHANEMPVTIGVFIDPGYKRSDLPPMREPRSTAENRSFEYDSLSPRYSEFLLSEILPHVTNEYGLKITDDAAGRAICGMSSGGICAWTAAWERPDQFGKVVSHVGSFTNIRGGHKYPELIRTADRKPIRVFLQDGASDNRNRDPDRNWVIANYRMAAALEEKDYDYKYVFGEGAHNGNHGGAILPDTLRWLWRDYPP
jgi:enterochelin esterase family protein